MPYNIERRKWADQFIPQIKSELRTIMRLHSYYGKRNIRVGTLSEDINDCIDLIIDEKIVVLVRTRTTKYINSGDFVLRTTNYNGTNEFDKVLDGKGKYLFYSYAPKDTTDGILTDWWLGRLNVFRKRWDREPMPYCKEMNDPDGTGTFSILKLSDYQNFVFSKKGNIKCKRC